MPRKMAQINPQVSNYFAFTSYPVMGETFRFNMSRLVSAKDMITPYPRMAPQPRTSRDALDLAAGVRSRKINMFTASSMLSGSSV